jgi:hypothetical protein
MNNKHCLLPGMLVLAALAAGCEGGQSRNGDAPPPSNAAPTLTAIPAQAIDQDTSTSALAFTVADDGGLSGVTLTVSSSDTSIVSVSGIALGGSGASRTVTITPLEDATGSAVVGITATDAQGLASATSVALNVRAVTRSFASYSTTTFGQMENDTPAQVSGFTFTQDATDNTYDPLLQ